MFQPIKARILCLFCLLSCVSVFGQPNPVMPVNDAATTSLSQPGNVGDQQTLLAEIQQLKENNTSLRSQDQALHKSLVTTRQEAQQLAMWLQKEIAFAKLLRVSSLRQAQQRTGQPSALPAQTPGQLLSTEPTLPSFSHLLLMQTRRNLSCASGRCHFVRVLPVPNEKAWHQKTSPLLYGRHFMPVTLTAIILFVFLLIVFIALLLAALQHKKDVKNPPEKSRPYEAVAGDNVAETQLDVAQALIELDDKVAAKQALQAVIEHGDDAQKQQAETLLNQLDS
jgi:FimV-like protein